MTHNPRHPKDRHRPLLSVWRGAAAIEFYKTEFGDKVLFRIDDDKGEVVATLSVGGAKFWVADEAPASAPKPLEAGRPGCC